MAASRFVIGIDLGTTNTVMAYAEAFEDRRPEVKQFEIPQLVAAGTVADRALLPSFVYLPGETDFKAEMLELPWQANTQDAEEKPAKKKSPEWLVGELAKTQGGLISHRLVHSSKSWLCHDSVDRQAAILPWGTETESKISPVEAAERIIQHLRNCWNHKMARNDDSARFEKQEIILTVPASFDEVARNLTVEAATKAGITRENLVLLEEPQAAFYAWLSLDPDKRQNMIKAGEKVLVVDMGGGTTDLSLFSTSVGEESVNFQRTAVGEHLLLGGDNIDLALAKLIESEFKKKTKKLSIRQWQTLLQGCRAAKEKMLQSEIEEIKITIPGKGSKLIGGQLKRTLTRTELFDNILGGFFPEVTLEAKKKEATKSGLQEFGLPFESDPAVTRHLLEFLRDHCSQDGVIEVPKAVLFNGGVFKTEALRKRIVEVLSTWRTQLKGEGQDNEVLVLHSENLDLAVSHGAAYYGLVRRGYGIRIRAGLPRSYYVGVESETKSRQAICLISQGVEEGTSVDVQGHELDLVTRRPVGFPLFTSTTRAQDKPGDLVEINDEDFREMPPLLTVLKLGRKSKRKSVPVGLRAKLTEIGTLELFCKSLVTDHEWQLDFTVRKASTDDTGPSEDELQASEAAVKHVLTVFRGKASFEESRERLEKIFKTLEHETAQKRADWSLYKLRKIWDDGLSPVSKNRQKTALHESRWLNLAGYCLRPGFGNSTDDHRIRSYWRVILEGPHNAGDPRVKIEWLVALRRIAGGLSKGQQQQLAARLKDRLKLSSKSKGNKAEEANEAWRVLANLELLPKDRKVEFGQRLVNAKSQQRGPRCLTWALGRLGARVLVYGTADTVVDPATVSNWIEAILQNTEKLRIDDQFALISMARLTGDRTRDIDQKLREKVIYRLKKSGAGNNQIRPLQEAVSLASNETSSALGDTIPTGLQLKASS